MNMWVPLTQTRRESPPALLGGLRSAGTRGQSSPASHGPKPWSGTDLDLFVERVRFAELAEQVAELPVAPATPRYGPLLVPV